MTISSSTRKAGPFTGNGVTTAYPFAFKVFSASDLLVVLALTSTGAETVQTITTNYTVALNADQSTSPGGTVTMLVAPAAGYTLTLTSQVANLQPTDLTNAGGFYPKVINDALDRATIQIQQLAEKAGRALQVSVSTVANIVLPAPSAGTLLGWDATGSNLINIIAQTGTSLVNLASSAGSSLVGFTQSGTGAIARTSQDKARESVSVKDFGAVGDGVTDDTLAIQAAINYVCNQTTTTIGNGGGRLFFPAGKYRFTDTLRVGYGLCIEGVWGGGYPYVGPAAQTSQLWADFGTNINKWAIDSQTFHSAAGGGGRILYNEWMSGSIDGTSTDGFNSIHGLSIKNILLTDANGTLQTNVIYGSIRLVGCPNANLENVTIFGFGYSLTLNCSFGTRVRNIASQTNYYGLMAYNSNNGIDVQGQFDKIVSPSRLTVPVGVIPSWMPSAATFTSGSFNMNGSHYQSAKGITVAAAQAVGSNGATIDVIGQYWDDTVFLYNSYSSTFTQLYSEQCYQNVLATCYGSFNILNAHNYSTIGPLPYFGDFGYQSIGEINVGGNNTALAFFQNVWSGASAADPSYILVHSTSNGSGPAVPLGTISIPSRQRINKMYEEGFWTPTLSVPAGALTTVGACSGSYTKVGRLVTAQFSCAITTNGTGSGYIIVGGLPYNVNTVSFVSGGREQGVTGKMTMVQAQPGTTNAFVWFSDGTYPGANGAVFNGSITYQT